MLVSNPICGGSASRKLSATYVSMRQHTLPAYVSIRYPICGGRASRKLSATRTLVGTKALRTLPQISGTKVLQNLRLVKLKYYKACGEQAGNERSIRQHTPAYVSIRQDTCDEEVGYERQHTPAYASIRQHTP